jgi:uncharacterized protein (TIGR02266 family)
MITKDSKVILVADDSLFFRTKLEDTLTEGGHRVRLTTNGSETIDAMKDTAEGLDLLILDLQMPEIDGFGVMDWIEENGLRGKFPILVMTSAYKTGTVLEHLKNSPATGFMQKDFSPQEVLLRVNSHIFQYLHDKTNERTNPRERVPVSTSVDFTIGDCTDTGFLLNVSEAGTFINTSTELPVDTPVRLVFSLPGIDRVFDLDGIVRWNTARMATTTKLSGGGLVFINVTSEDRMILRGFVAAEVKRLGLYSHERAEAVV